MGIWVIPAQMCNFFGRPQIFCQKPSKSSEGSITRGNMAFYSHLGPFLGFIGVNFDTGVKKVDFSYFLIFFTFLLIKSYPVGHFSSPVCQMKGFFSGIQDIWSWKGSKPSNHGNLLPSETKFFLYQLTFGSFSQKTYLFFLVFF